MSVCADDAAGIVAALQELAILLVEDDPGDAALVEELVGDEAQLRMHWVRSIADAGEYLTNRVPDCVLLDLHLPDAQGIEALARIHEYTDVAVVVMTGLDEERTGLAAVAAGAQDYLVKGRVEPELFGRSVRYAVQRKQAERATVALHASQMRARENARLERGLLPTPLLPNDSAVQVISRYRPGRDHALLGGDFYDVVQDHAGLVHAVIGDVSGHDPDAAATGVALRLAWRTLVLSGIVGMRQLQLLERVLLAERADRQTFATATTLVLDPVSRTVWVRRAGHPGLLVHSGAELHWLEVPGGPALGFVPRDAQWPSHELSLPVGTSLMLLTDGLFEGCVDAAKNRLGEQGLLELARDMIAAAPEQFVDDVIARVEDLAEAAGGLEDDLAILHLRWRSEAV
ncbi:fused response regulator/phosphatase [Nocardia sp. CA2R105]|uniref:PP2C family protein-serine/threonine phosphatase n=1 Tax=Nocardia coffeae TaxID=2873381 RepID=UPI001CA79DCF|nr:fused response regulator/phosphatase [Nocardia coffeae]MBY8862091.1 fused response regulator/phosphatase [Nocardia coffeae]